jgi:hypothetical protein
MSTDNILTPLETESQIKNWIIELTNEVKLLRTECDLAITVEKQRLSYVRYLMHQGEALGALVASKRLNKISDQTYMELREQIMATRIPTVVQK